MNVCRLNTHVGEMNSGLAFQPIPSPIFGIKNSPVLPNSWATPMYYGLGVPTPNGVL